MYNSEENPIKHLATENMASGLNLLKTNAPYRSRKSNINVAGEAITSLNLDAGDLLTLLLGANISEVDPVLLAAVYTKIQGLTQNNALPEGDFMEEAEEAIETTTTFLDAASTETEEDDQPKSRESEIKSSKTEDDDTFEPVDPPAPGKRPVVHRKPTVEQQLKGEIRKSVTSCSLGKGLWLQKREPVKSGNVSAKSILSRNWVKCKDNPHREERKFTFYAEVKVYRDTPGKETINRSPGK